MKVEIKDSNYVTNIIGSRRYDSRYFYQPYLPDNPKQYSFKEMLDYVGDNDINKAEVLRDYYETLQADWNKSSTRTFTLLSLWACGCFAHAVAHAIVHKDTSLLVEEMPVMAGVASLLLSCGITEKSLEVLAIQKDDDIRKISAELKENKREKENEERRRKEEEERLEHEKKEKEYGASIEDFLEISEARETSDPNKYAKMLAQVKFDAFNELYQDTSINCEHIITMPGVQEFINKKLIKLAKEKDSDFYRDNPKYKVSFKIIPTEDGSFILDFYLNKNGLDHISEDEYKVSPCNDDNPEHYLTINYLHRDYFEYPNFEYRIVDNKEDYAEIRHCSAEQLGDAEIEKLKTIYLNEHGDVVDEVLKEKEENKVM